MQPVITLCLLDLERCQTRSLAAANPKVQTVGKNCFPRRLIAGDQLPKNMSILTLNCARQTTNAKSKI